MNARNDERHDPQPAVPHHAVAIIGGGQAGLSMSRCLRDHGIDHVVLERHRVGHAWREERWDSFCLVTPNWQCNLPGFPYDGDAPHGFMEKEAIVRYVEAFARSFEPPLREGVDVGGLRRRADGRFELTTSSGSLTADQVVVATGGYHTPVIPRLAERLPGDVMQLHSREYRNAASLPTGAVLVVGSGQSGCQIAEDLHLAGRTVHLCVGSAPRTARRYRGRDVVDWLADLGYYDMPVEQHPLKERVRAKANHYVTGRDGGRDIDLRRFALEGMVLHGRLDDLRGTHIRFRDDLATNLDQADAVAESIKDTVDRYIDKAGIDAPTEARYVPVWRPGSTALELDLRDAGITSVIWCVGYRADFRWIELPAFDGSGHPAHRRGVSAVDGLYFLGLPWLHTWGSGRFSGIARDAAHLAEQVTAKLGKASARPATVNEWALGS
ncbi:MAG: MSMEG_0569 family flavin-dependent oxidoreductase [Burkholderiales bacterium]|nr:MSMEG_0569 family flavin-dependent oxidoreductase [Burkholderiales bacterium]